MVMLTLLPCACICRGYLRAATRGGKSPEGKLRGQQNVDARSAGLRLHKEQKRLSYMMGQTSNILDTAP